MFMIPKGFMEIRNMKLQVTILTCFYSNENLRLYILHAMDKHEEIYMYY